MKFPVIEIVDRYTIAVVKHEKTNGANQEELDFYTIQINQIGIALTNPRLIELIEHHSSTICTCVSLRGRISSGSG
jgi:MoaA/NifB/PqqE/SkfB family radical SAM enzyme